LFKKNVRVITILLSKWCHNNRHFAGLAPHHGWKNSWRRRGMKKSRHCHLVHCITV